MNILRCCVLSLFLAGWPSIISAQPAQAEQTTLDEDFESAWQPQRWVFSDGPDFRDGEFSTRDEGGAHEGEYGGCLSFDFTDGGNYVAAAVRLEKSPPLAAVHLWLKKPAGHDLTLRYTDQTDQTLQRSFWAPDGRWVRVLVPFSDWNGHWGGAQDGQVHGPPKQIAVLIERGGEAVGELLMDEVRFLAGAAGTGTTTSTCEYQAFDFGTEEQWQLRHWGPRGGSRWEGSLLRCDFSQGADAVGLVPGDVSLLGNPLEIRIRARGLAAGHPVRLQIATHFMTFEKTVGEFAGDGEIVVSAPPGEGWSWSGGENDGKRHGPLRIRGLYLDASDVKDTVELELRDIIVKTSSAADRCCVLLAECRQQGTDCQFMATTRNLSSRPIRARLAHQIRDWAGNLVSTGSHEITVPAGGVPLTTVVSCPLQERRFLEAEFVMTAPEQLVPATQAYYTAPLHTAPLHTDPLHTDPGRQSDPASPFGMGLYLYRYGNDPAGRATMARAAQLGAAAGVKWSREEFNWSRIESQRGQYDWSFYDHLVATAKQEGIKVYGLLAYWSRWTEPYTAEGIEDYCRFATAAAQRYRDDIQHWEVYNEPNIFFWQGPRDMYAQLLTQAHAAIKGANPDAIVLGCSTAGIDLEFVRRTMELGAPFDVLTIHPYRSKLDDQTFISDLLEAARVAAGDDGGSCPVWITEMGWATHVPHNSAAGGFRVTTQRDQACLLARTYIDAIASGVTPNISWYDFRNDGTDPFNFEHNMGVVTHDFRPKPAYRAFATVTHLLSGSGVVTPLDLGEAVTAFRFTFPGRTRQVIALWSTRHQNTVRIPVTTATATLVDLMGSSTPLAPQADQVEVMVERDKPVFVVLP